MKQNKGVVISTLNARYSHTSLACRYLKAELENNGIKASMMEFNINLNPDKVLENLIDGDFFIYAFSTYIWNVDITLYLCRNIKKLHPGCVIILGGPEVSFNPNEIFKREPSVDYIVCGEGEGLFAELIKNICQGKNIDSEFVATKEKPEAKYHTVENLNDILFPYSDIESIDKDKLVYYETSRGCIYSCSYCLSCISKGMRFLNLDRVKREINILSNAGVKVLKFTDRTFNANKARAIEIMRHIIDIKSQMRVHFEICAHLIDDEFLAFLMTVPSGIFQFEIGIQSANKSALEAVNRKTDINRALNVCKALKDSKIEIHLDLIAGLPYDRYSDNLDAIDLVFDKCDVLFLGFLKLLNGSVLKEQVDKFGYIYDDKAPYICFENKFISYEDMNKLKRIEFIIDKYKNSGDFEKSLDFLIRLYKKPTAFLTAFADYLMQLGFYDAPVGKDALFLALHSFMEKVIDTEEFYKFEEALRFDYIKNYKGINPVFIKRDYGKDFKGKCEKFLKNEKNLLKYSHFFKDITDREAFKKTRFHMFNFDGRVFVYMFLIGNKSAQDVTRDFLNSTEIKWFSS